MQQLPYIHPTTRDGLKSGKSGKWKIIKPSLSLFVFVCYLLLTVAKEHVVVVTQHDDLYKHCASTFDDCVLWVFDTLGSWSKEKPQ